MKAYGYRVIRFTNEAIMYDLSSVLDSIRAASRPVAPETVPTNTDGSHHTKDCC